MTTLYYLAYGSNLHPLRLQERVASARFLGTVILPGFQLAFHKIGADGSAKCNILSTQNHADTVHAALFSMHRSHKAVLDDFEGEGYLDIDIQVALNRTEYNAFAYVAETEFIDEQLAPYDWYKDLVLYGARHHKLPDDYVAAIHQVDAVTDPDADRSRRHASLLASMRELF